MIGDKSWRCRVSNRNLVEVIQIWKVNFTKFQPPCICFYAFSSGFAPDELLFINSSIPVMPGTPGLLPIPTDVMALYSDKNMFIGMTPEGQPESGWNTFGTSEEEGTTVAQIQSMTRATDPIYGRILSYLPWLDESGTNFGLKFRKGTRTELRKG